MMYMLNEIAREAGRIREKSGFTAPSPENLDQKLLLVVSELCEVQGEMRDGHTVTEIYYPTAVEQNGPHGPLDKPEGVPIELADALIRILDIAGALGIDIAEAVELKMAYNERRPFKHGRKF